MRNVQDQGDTYVAVAPSTTAPGPGLTATAAPSRTESSQPPGSAWVAAAVITTVAALGLVVGWAVHSGAIRRAYSDDWAYLRIAHQFVTKGTLDGVGWNDTSLLGQLFATRLLAPITGSTVAGLRVISILAAAGSLVLVAVLARRSKTSALWPLIPLTLVALPGFGSTVATYMTEQAALFAQLLCLVLGLVIWRQWTRSGRLPWAYLAALAAAGAWAGSIRQAAIAAPLAVVATLLTHPGAQRRQRGVIAAIGAGVIAFVLLLVAATPLGGPTMAIVRGSLSGQVARVYQAVATIALFLVPLAIVTGWFGRARQIAWDWRATARGRIALAGIAVVVVLGGVLLHRRTGSLIVGNSLQQAGGYQGMDLLSPNLFSGPVWFVIEALAAGALFMLLVLVVSAGRHLGGAWRTGGWRAAARPFTAATALTRMAAIWTTLAVLAALAVNLAYRAIYDRYLLPVVIGLALVAIDNAIAPTPRPRHLAFAAAAFCPLLLLGVVAATDTQDLLALRWDGGDRLVELGYQPDQIDAGFDWVGYHYPGIARPDRVVLEPADYPPATYDAYFPEFHRCAFVSPVPMMAPANYALVETMTRHRLFGLRSDTVYLYGATRDGGLGACLASGQG